MDYQIAILLYSNYSNISKQLLQNLQQIPLDVIKLQTICIDNEHIRKRILKSKTINITTIPSLLLVYNNGGVEKYDGQTVFSLVESLIQKYLPPPPPQEIPQQIPQQPHQEVSQEAPQQPHQKVLRKKEVKRKQQKLPPVMETRMEDLDNEEEEEEDIEIERPPAAIRNGPGGYDLSTEIISDDADRDAIEQNIQKINSAKAGGLMAAAMAMQNEREK